MKTTRNRVIMAALLCEGPFIPVGVINLIGFFYLTATVVGPVPVLSLTAWVLTKVRPPPQPTAGEAFSPW